MEEFMTASYNGWQCKTDHHDRHFAGGDNARSSHWPAGTCQPTAHQRHHHGTAGAIILRVILIAFALALLAIPPEIVGALLLLWISVGCWCPKRKRQHQLQRQALGRRQDRHHCRPGHERGQRAGGAGARRRALRRTFPVGAGNFGLLLSIPIIIGGSQLLKLMERLPVVITLGAMLLGWIAGQMAYRSSTWLLPEARTGAMP
jgi:predicted tellurium resistance membrane protein TerC